MRLNTCYLKPLINEGVTISTGTARPPHPLLSSVTAVADEIVPHFSKLCSFLFVGKHKINLLIIDTISAPLEYVLVEWLIMVYCVCQRPEALIRLQVVRLCECWGFLLAFILLLIVCQKCMGEVSVLVWK